MNTKISWMPCTLLHTSSKRRCNPMTNLLFVCLAIICSFLKAHIFRPLKTDTTKPQNQTPKATPMCDLVSAVATRRCLPRETVEQAIYAFLHDLTYVLAGGGTYHVIGFGHFSMAQDGKTIEFTKTRRTTLRVENRPPPDGRMFIVNAHFSCQKTCWPWFDTIRTAHHPDDPIIMTFFVEINRKLFFKEHEVDIVGMGVFDGTGFQYAPSNCFRNMVEDARLQQQRTLHKVTAWVPRLVMLLAIKHINTRHV